MRMTRLSFVVFAVALLARTQIARAQTFYGAAGGVQGTRPGLRYFTAQASIGRRISHRFETRLDAFVSHWVDRGGVAITCEYDAPPGCSGIYTYHDPKSVTGLAGNVIVNVSPPVHGPQAYLIGGVGAYCLGGDCLGSNDPWYKGFLPNMRFGPSVGMGGSMAMGRRSRMFLEARFHYLMRRAGWYESHYLLPVTLGIRL